MTLMKQDDYEHQRFAWLDYCMTCRRAIPFATPSTAARLRDDIKIAQRMLLELRGATKIVVTA